MRAIRWGGKFVAASVMLTLALTGCKSTPTRSGTSVTKAVTHPFTKPDNVPTGSVNQIAVMWSDALLRQDNVPMTQGFVGKIYLFGGDGSQTITAPGKFMFCAYNDSKGRVEPGNEHIKPDRVWEFRESELRSMLKKDLVGWSYSFWLPYGPPDSSERLCSMIVVFTPEQGQKVISETSLVTLPAVGGGQSGVQMLSSAKPATTPSDRNDAVTPNGTPVAMNGSRE
jgi:hypothetical protein